MTNNEERTCKNCKYFSEHYFIYRDYLKPAGYGNCLHACTPHKKRHRRDIDAGCKNPEPAEIRKNEQNERIENTIREMERRLTQILLILNTE